MTSFKKKSKTIVMVAPKFLLGLAFCSGALARTVKETLRITWKEGAPNGQSRELIHTNGQFPGPALVWDEDDDIEASTTNDHISTALALTQHR